MANLSRNILDSFCDPMAIVSETGEILDTNQAFDRQTAACPERAWLADLFGATTANLVEDAITRGEARGTYTMRRGNETRYVRIALRRETSTRLHAQIVDLTDDLSWREQASERDETLTVLQEIGAALSGVVDLDTLTEKIFEQTNRVIRSDNFYVALHDSETNTISFPRYIEDGRWTSMTSRPFGTGLTEHVINAKAPLLFNHDVAAHARELGIEPVGRPSMAWMGVPMIADGQAIGMIGLQDFEKPNCYTPRDVKLLTVVASQAAAAIRNTWLLSAAQRAYHDLSEAQERLLETERVRGVTETVGALNHEINNPLSAIVGNAQLLLKSRKDLDDDHRHKIEAMLEAARRIQRVTSKMETLIAAGSMKYPGGDSIIDVHGSVSNEKLEAATEAAIQATSHRLN